MKKYWKVLLICLLIVTTISTYYVQAAIASKSQSTMKLELINGNEEELENLVLQAGYSRGYQYKTFDITKEGATNVYGESIIESALYPRVPHLLKAVTEEHRDFMRAKNLYADSFYEDDTRLIYVVSSDHYNESGFNEPLIFKIDMLDKNTNDRTSFEVETPSAVGYGWNNILNVHVENGKIKIVIMMSFQTSEQELRMYEIDEQQQTITDDLLIMKIPSNSYTPSLFSSNKQTLGNQNYNLLNVRKHTDDEQAYDTVGDVYIFNTQTGELESLEIPAGAVSNLDYSKIDGSELYLPNISAEGVVLHHYNFDTKQWAEPLTITYPEKVVDESSSTVYIFEDRLYSVNRLADRSMLMIYDLHTGEVLAEVEITTEDLTKENWLRVESIYREV